MTVFIKKVCFSIGCFFLRRRYLSVFCQSGLIALSVIFLASCDQGERLSSREQPVPVPALMAQSGQPFQLTNYRGRWLVLNYWASWCQPCRQEIPELNAFSRHHPEQEVAVVGINLDPYDWGRMPQLITEFAISYPVVLGHPDNKGFTQPEMMPATIFINPQGKVIHSEVRLQTLSHLESVLANARRQELS